ncbi:hypothetical protein L7F22_040855 [Adiantum nelumboides]|nr:hypothetical protein [Adiantum nelumboides]
MVVEYECNNGRAWQQQELEGYASFIKALNKPKLQELEVEAQIAESCLDDDVKITSLGSFLALPDLNVAISVLSALKGVGPATTASATLATVAPDVAPFMSDEGMIAIMGNVKDYTLK